MSNSDNILIIAVIGFAIFGGIGGFLLIGNVFSNAGNIEWGMVIVGVIGAVGLAFYHYFTK